MAAPVPLLVSLLVTPGLADVGTPATLTVRLSIADGGRWEAALPDDDACFVARSVQLVLYAPDGRALAPRPCAPGGAATPVKVSAGHPFVREVRLGPLFPDAGWGHGTWRVEAGWTGPMRQSSLGGDVLRRAKPLGEARIEVGKPASLPDGTRWLVTAHGHKRTLRGERSPLLVALRFRPRGGDERELSLAVDTDDRVFEVDGHVYELAGHASDEWMTLRCYGRLGP